MKAIVVTERAAGTAGMKLVQRPEPQAAISDVVVLVHASGFVGTELAWPSTWADRLQRDRTPSIPGHELAGVVTALGYGTTGLSVGQRVFGLADWYRDGTLAEYAAVEARNLAPLPGDVDFTVAGDIGKRSARLVRTGGTLVSIVGPSEARPADGLAVDFVVESDRTQLSEIVQRVRDGRLRTNIGTVATLDDAVAAFNPTERRPGKTIIRVRP
ncbi:MAG TPA: alcohol dehydrogenase catalytic domain-containing protein [Gemmatimonadales bacterium]|nr:alcohol dehydrogenase catalytic domain-containing protein [Gemmatimonadales bacterium]